MLGSCFLFRQDSYALTAKHCVPEGWNVYCEFPFLKKVVEISGLVRHESIDLALICFEEPIPPPDGFKAQRASGVQPQVGFWDAGGLRWGEDVSAFGYPTEVIIEARSGIRPRLFKGHVQTFHGQDEHTLAELSFAAPGGLSGGPVFGSIIPDLVSGVISANYDSIRVIDSIDEIDDAGNRIRIESRRVVSYGLAIPLQDHTDWLNEHTPRPY